ncbi:alpha/beta fold hydrolase [Marinomonas shanghaiensis]|uniref:alpha/beta fold hydrolase n=1 Tax=Marinomonas shanghaiensis TaxID=2202418 RepID=UPI003A910310
MLTDVYCLPGTMCDQRLWETTQQALGTSMSLRHVAIPMEHSIELILAELASVLPKGPINLLGFSMGGYLACAFALTYPERINRLMVLSNTASGLLDSERQQREVALNWVAKQGYNGIPRKKAIAMLSPSNQAKTALLECILAMDKTLGEAVFIQQLKSSLDRPNLLPKLEKTKFPLGFIVGRDDVLLSNDTIEVMKTSDQITLQVVEACGHMVPLEQPALLADSLRNFYR